MAIQASVSVRGLLAGGVAGAILRPLALYSQIGDQAIGDSTPTVLLISSMIGCLAGAAAGAIGRPLWSAFAGSVLASLAYFLTFIPLAFCLCFGAIERQQAGNEPPVWWLMAVTGAISGVIGGGAERLGRNRSSPSTPTQTGNSAPPATL